MTSTAHQVPMARLVAAGLDRTTAAIHAVPTGATDDTEKHTRRAERLHQLYTRRARWWAVLERAGATDHKVPTVYLRAVVQARCVAEIHAADWAAIAERWIDRTPETPAITDELAARADVAGSVSI